ncbi:hypothetical protein [Sporosarcina koreensis]|uniref:hypothetical protein n=1 Tax=Sporosarcina koreensis TaxID=334735 RepID=UPI000AFBDF8A|nr:hypothetical protein [Sporosarcina koreensis]
MLRTLYRTIDGERRVIHGHLSKYEVAALRKEGWREDRPQTNRHGIPIGRAV